MIFNKKYLNLLSKKEIGQLLSILYMLEDKTEYKNKKITRFIDFIQNNYID